VVDNKTVAGADATEQALYDALGAAIDPFRNVLHRDRASKVVALQADMVAKDETWTTYEGGPAPPPAPTLTSLSPDTAVLGDPDIVMSCIGTGFTAESVIYFADQDEPTTLVSDTEVTTGVKPSLPWGAVTVPVYVRNGSLASEPLDFTFTEPVARRGRS
jgi:hypothetical protein